MKKAVMKKLVSVLLGIAMAAFLIPCGIAYAEEPSCTLCIDFRDENTPISGTAFRAYLAAELLEHGQYKLTDSFAGSGAVLKSQMANGDWMAATDALAGWAEKNHVAPTVEGHTGTDGKLSFTGLSAGLYLVEGSDITVGETIYTPQTFCVMVPDRDEHWNPVYTVTIEPKFKTAPVPKPTPAPPSEAPKEPPTDTPTKKPGMTPPPKTEDTFPYEMWGLLAGISLLGIAGTSSVLRKEQQTT